MMIKALNWIVLFVSFSMVFVCSFANAQSNPILDDFSILGNNGKVYLNWIIKSGSTCNGIQIFRSSNNSSFIEIGNIAGVCGNISFATSYNFIDENPVKNTVNSYRLELGNNGTSQTLSIEVIDIGKEGSQVRPNPIYDNAKIYFDNNTKELHYLFIYDAIGKIISKASTKEDYFQYNSNSILNGTYFFKILNNEQIVTTQGKFVVMH
jgi:hypothetical protein